MFRGPEAAQTLTGAVAAIPIGLTLEPAGTDCRLPRIPTQASNGMTATTYDLSFEEGLGELQAALGRSVNVMIRPRDPAAQPQVLAHMSGRLMRAESKYAGSANEAARAAQGESLF